MRTAFIDTLTEIAAADERIWLLTGDLGYSVLERYAERIPERYVNVGVAEQNMVGIAAGLAHCGKTVVTYSIANFATLRCFEQIRNDVRYHEADVKIVSVGGGFAYGAQGYSHHGIEDLAVMRALPGLTVLAPGDPAEAAWATGAMLDRPGPCYLRLGKAGEPVVHARGGTFEIGRAACLRDGSDVTLISTGGMLRTTVDAADRLAAEHHIESRVLSMHTIKPLDEAAVRAAMRETGGVVTAEEHSVTGGLGSAVAEVLASVDGPTGSFRRFGAPDRLHELIGDQTTMRAVAGELEATVLSMLAGTRA